MSFVNEFVPQEDVRKYGLDALWAKYHGRDWQTAGFRHTWTVDREREIWFIPIMTGREEFSGRKTCALNIGDEQFEVTIELAPESTGKFDAVPFTRVWRLISIKPDGLSESKRESVTSALKEALTTFGYDGVHWQVPKTVVGFQF